MKDADKYMIHYQGLHIIIPGYSVDAPEIVVHGNRCQVQTSIYLLLLHK